MKKVYVALLALLVSLGTAQAQNAFLANPDMEQDADANLFPDNWFGFSQLPAGFQGAWVSGTSFDGTHSLRFDNRTAAGTFQGIVAFRDEWTAGPGGLKEFMPVAAGTPVSFSAWFLEGSGADAMTAGTGEIKIEWASSGFGTIGQALTTFNGSQINDTTWTQLTASGIAPVGTSYAKFVVVDVVNGANTGSFYADGLAAIPEPSTLAMMAMGGLAMVGYAFRRLRK